MAQITLANVVAIAPGLTGTDPTAAADVIADVYMQLPEADAWGGEPQLNYAAKYLAAHFLTLLKEANDEYDAEVSGEPIIGALKSETVGPVTRSYETKFAGASNATVPVGDLAPGSALLARTGYGMEFLRWQSVCFSGQAVWVL